MKKRSENTSLNPPRPKFAPPLWRRRTTALVLAVLVLGIVSGAGVWAYRSGWAENRLQRVYGAFVVAAGAQGFTLQNVLVTGRLETDRAALLAALSVVRGAPILSYDFAAAQARVEALPWVLQSRIERRLPDTLVVHLIERRPLALWQYKGRFALIDEDGVVITRRGLGRFSGLFQVVGAQAPDTVGGLLELLATQPRLKAQVKAAVRVGKRRWDLVMKTGVDVRLPEKGAPQAWARLAKLQRETDILKRDVRVLDLRMRDRVIVRRFLSAKARGRSLKSTPHSVKSTRADRTTRRRGGTQNVS